MAESLVQRQVPAAAPAAAAAALARETCRVWRLSLLCFQQKDHYRHQQPLKCADAHYAAAAAAMPCHHAHECPRAAAVELAAAAATTLN